MSAVVTNPDSLAVDGDVSASHKLASRIWLAVALVATALDAALSYLSIEVLGIAIEGNPLLASLATQVGFFATMLVRFLVGAALLYAVYRIALKTGARSLADRGLRFVSLVLGGLTIYHLIILAAGAMAL